MQQEMTIQGHSAKITVRILGYENDHAEDLSDANWLKAHITFNVGEIAYNSPAAFTTYDFARVVEELHSIYICLNGKATLSSDEDLLDLAIVMNSNGRSEVSGVANLLGLPKISITFSFESDQTFLKQTYEDAKEIISHFPVIYTLNQT